MHNWIDTGHSNKISIPTIGETPVVSSGLCHRQNAQRAGQDVEPIVLPLLARLHDSQPDD